MGQAQAPGWVGGRSPVGWAEQARSCWPEGRQLPIARLPSAPVRGNRPKEILLFISYREACMEIKYVQEKPRCRAAVPECVHWRCPCRGAREECRPHVVHTYTHTRVPLFGRRVWMFPKFLLTLDLLFAPVLSITSIWYGFVARRFSHS